MVVWLLFAHCLVRAIGSMMHSKQHRGSPHTRVHAAERMRNLVVRFYFSTLRSLCSGAGLTQGPDPNPAVDR